MSAATPLLYLATRAAMKANLFQQPGLLRTVHRMEGSAESLHTSRVRRLHRGITSGFFSTLAEDLGEHLRSLTASLRRRPSAPSADEQQAAMIATRACPMPPSLPARDESPAAEVAEVVPTNRPAASPISPATS